MSQQIIRKAQLGIAFALVLAAIPAEVEAKATTRIRTGALRASQECPRPTNPGSDFVGARRQLVLTLDGIDAENSDSLVDVYCSLPRWQVDERLFFSHPAVEGMSEVSRSRFLSAVATLDPTTVLEIASASDLEGDTQRIAVRALERSLVQALSIMPTEDQLATFLGEVTAADLLSGRNRRRLSTDHRTKVLSSDPAIKKNFQTIQDQWFLGLAEAHLPAAPLYRDLGELVQLKIMVARNLSFRGRPVTQASVAEEYGRIVAARAVLQDLPIFGERRTLYVADDATWESGEPIFGSARSLRRLRDQGTVLRFEPDSGPGGGAVELAVTEVRETRDLTLVLAGHGRPSSLQIGKGLPGEELARAFVARANQAGSDDSPAILIAMSCEAHDFARAVLDAMHRMDPAARKPIVIVPVEFGQPFLEYPSEPFLARDLGLRTGGPSTLGGVFAQARPETSIFVADENNLPMQVL